MKKHWILALLPGLMLFGNAAHALGLGDIEVRSYLGQPIAARIQLIGTSRQELLTVTASLAAASDYEFVGMKQNLSVPLRFVIDSNPERPGIEVSSRLPVKEPVVQFVVEVSWSGGRMLKEYTLFLDPPTIASSAPVPAVFTRNEPPQEEFPDPDLVDVVETVKPEPVLTETAPVASAEIAESVSSPRAEQVLQSQQESESADLQEAVAGQPAVTVPFDSLAEEAQDGQVAVTDVEPVVDAEPSVEDLAQQELPESEVDVQQEPSSISETDASSDLAVDAELGDSSEPADLAAQEDEVPEAVAAPQTASAPRASRPVAATVPDNAESYGPVQRGDTLWSIASRLTQGTEFSINQAMLAIQRLNPDAFGGNNINSLQTGAILRMPASSEMRRMSRRQAMLEAMRQERVYASIRAGIPVQDEPPVLADLAPDPVVQTAQVDTAPALAEAIDEGRLELVPPSEGSGQSVGGNGSDAATGAISSEELSETLARTEEELANAQQENEYLAQRIRELEAQLAENRGTVENRDLAEMESSLREDRLSGDEEPEVRVRPPAEQPWYEGKIAWLIGALVLLVAFTTWLLRRLAAQKAAEVPESGSATVVKLRTEAEDILETLDKDGKGDKTPEVDVSDEVTESKPGSEAPNDGGRPNKPVAGPAEDSEVIELDSSDPETRLDLARAYISMNDPEAARQMLEEVLETGDEEQVREARDMMQELDN